MRLLIIKASAISLHCVSRGTSALMSCPRLSEDAQRFGGSDIGHHRQHGRFDHLGIHVLQHAAGFKQLSRQIRSYFFGMLLNTSLGAFEVSLSSTRQ
jgi:hypothetical protein